MSANIISSNDKISTCSQRKIIPADAATRMPDAVKKRGDINYLYAQQESNLYQKLRKLLFYPLNYGREYLPYCTPKVQAYATPEAFPGEFFRLSNGRRYLPMYGPAVP